MNWHCINKTSNSSICHVPPAFLSNLTYRNRSDLHTLTLLSLSLSFFILPYRLSISGKCTEFRKLTSSEKKRRCSGCSCLPAGNVTPDLHTLAKLLKSSKQPLKRLNILQRTCSPCLIPASVGLWQFPSSSRPKNHNIIITHWNSQLSRTTSCKLPEWITRVSQQGTQKHPGRGGRPS